MDPLDEQLVKEARLRGVAVRILLEGDKLDDIHRQRLAEYQNAGIAVRHLPSLPMKLAVFDRKRGMVALLDPLVTKPTWTAVLFDHPGMAEAMHGLFEDCWRRAQELG